MQEGEGQVILTDTETFVIVVITINNNNNGDNNSTKNPQIKKRVYTLLVQSHH